MAKELLKGKFPLASQTTGRVSMPKEKVAVKSNTPARKPTGKKVVKPLVKGGK